MELPGNKDASLFVMEVSEPRDNGLRLVLIDLPRRSPAHPQVRPHQTVYEIIWYHYVAYSIRNESYATSKGDGQEVVSGRLRQHSGSAFLNYVAATTFASDDFPGPGKLIHWALFTESHCIDVVGAEPPEIRVLPPLEAAPHIAAFD